ncbi:MAG: DNA repair protein RadA [Ruminococcaceae bacterium]|nr:DNA repair protein RadA [Oscillospiraceae bacterium]
MEGIDLKNKTVYVCTECGYESAKWMGKCPACESWSTLTEEIQVKTAAKSGVLSKGKAVPVKLSDVSVDDYERTKCNIGELDRVLGGGIVKGSLILVGGDPGIGKSTLLLQLAKFLDKSVSVFYISGEESEKQLKMRADRISVKNELFTVLSETDINVALSYVEKNEPDILIVDSIQTMYNPEISSAPGSVAQVRDITLSLMRLCKDTKTAVFIVGHVTKDGAIAGPKVLEHMVDCVLYFEGEKNQTYRVLRAVKNRFGSTNEIGVFEMTDEGLAEVKNPSLMMLSGRPENAPGSAVCCSVSGTRPVLSEIQALVCSSNFGMPRRMATGTDYNRVNLIIAVLEKRVGFNMQNQDAYVNVVGGIKLDEPAADLAIAAAVASSFKNRAIDMNTAVIGEIGLTGELRGVSQLEKRLYEVEKLGFSRCIIPEANEKSVKKMKTLQVITAKNVAEALALILI